MNKAEEELELENISGNFLIITEKQGRGVGRKGKHWYSPLGGLWFTLGIRGFELQSNFSLFCGIQLTKTLKKVINLAEGDIKLKWPNDVYIKEKKVAGIVLRKLSRYNYYLVGIGINTNFEEFPEELANNAISLKLIIHKEISHRKLMGIFLDYIQERLPEYLKDYRLDLNFYRKHDLLINKKIQIITEFAEYVGVYQGITSSGAILIRLDNESIQPFYAGEIRMI